MKLALVGATGRVGSRILAEALDCGHSVTAIARHIADLTPRPRLFAQSGDISDPAALAGLLKGHDAVVSAVRFANSDSRKLIEAVKASGVRRFVVVGGAGSLEVAPGKKLLDTQSRYSTSWSVLNTFANGSPLAIEFEDAMYAPRSSSRSRAADATGLGDGATLTR